MHYCCVPNCKGKWKKDGPLRFHCFPKDRNRRKQWIVAIKTGKTVSSTMKICSLHFTADSYEKLSKFSEYSILKKTAVPTEHLPIRSHDQPKRQTTIRSSRATRADRRELIKKQAVTVVETPVKVSELESGSFDLQADKDLNVIESQMISQESHASEYSIATEEVSKEGLTRSISTQTDESALRNCTSAVSQNVAVQTSPHCRSVESQTNDYGRFGQFLSSSTVTEQEMKYFTGFSCDRFFALLAFLMKHSSVGFVCVLGIADQLLLTLCKYKLNLDFMLISTLFKMDRRKASDIFLFWTDKIYLSLKSVDWWSLRTCGPDFYTVIIDCTEIPTERSSNPELHQQMFSQYKNRPTWKGLVGIDEKGIVIYVSEVFGGSISDKQIVALSDFLKYLKAGDIVLADRGFDISDLLEKMLVALNIPPFKRNRPQLEETEVMYTRRVAQRRIHVERLIGYGKVNQILVEVMPECLWEKASQIFYNCMMLCNFKEGIVH